MPDLINNDSFQDLLTSLAAGELNFQTGLVWVIIATIFSMIGGAIGGIILAGKDLGYQLAAILGGIFGPAGVIPAVILGLVVLNLLRNY
jgi:hypothetical protein